MKAHYFYHFLIYKYNFTLFCNFIIYIFSCLFGSLHTGMTGPVNYLNSYWKVSREVLPMDDTLKAWDDCWISMLDFLSVFLYSDSVACPH